MSRSPTVTAQSLIIFRFARHSDLALAVTHDTPPTGRNDQLTVINDLFGFAAASRPLDI